jgi:hypothetical protein
MTIRRTGTTDTFTTDRPPSLQVYWAGLRAIEVIIEYSQDIGLE